MKNEQNPQGLPEKSQVFWAARWTVFDSIAWLVLLTMLLFVVPQLRDYFEEWEQDLAWPMELIISMSIWIRKNLILVFPILGIGAVVNFVVLLFWANPWRSIWNIIMALTPVFALVTVVMVSVFEYYELIRQVADP